MRRTPGRERGRILVCLVGAALLSCSASSQQQSFNPDDPFDDPFFEDGFAGGDSLDEVWNEPAPSAGYLAADGEDAESRLLGEQSDPMWDEGDRPLGDDLPPGGERSLGEKASEAAVATMSVLFAAGMTALPFLIGAY